VYSTLLRTINRCFFSTHRSANVRIVDARFQSLLACKRLAATHKKWRTGISENGNIVYVTFNYDRPAEANVRSLTFAEIANNGMDFVWTPGTAQHRIPSGFGVARYEFEDGF
jgi:hypothetical protein